MRGIYLIFILKSCFILFSCNTIEQVNLGQSITEENINKHISILASDKFLGRYPGSQGEKLTTRYIIDELIDYGVKPAQGTNYLQSFTIKKINQKYVGKLTLTSNGKFKDYTYGKDFFVATSTEFNDTLKIKGIETVFAGFGIVSPKNDWDDYKNKDVNGKIVFVLDKDPGYYDEYSNLFNGNNYSYFSSSKHKKEEALKRGAIGVFIITSEFKAKLDFFENRKILFPQGLPILASDGLLFSGLLSSKVIDDLPKSYSFDYIKKALSKDFFPIDLKITSSLKLRYDAEDSINTNNVIGIIKGEKYPDEYILYTAHWDHLGTKKTDNEKDSIYNGAIDNASGVAMQLEVAKAFSKMPSKPERSIIFLFTSAEEMGLFGAEYYANNPIYPLEKTVCVINSDGHFAVDRMRVVINVIQGYTEMDSFVEKAAKKLGRKIYVDSTGAPPPGNLFMRSDHYPFVKKAGVPAVWNVGNFDPLSGDQSQNDKVGEYVRNHYHKVTDEFFQGFNTSNIAFDAQLNFLTGIEIANSTEWPNWKKALEYKVLRDNNIINQNKND